MDDHQEPNESDWKLHWGDFIKVVDSQTPDWLIYGRKPTESELDEWEKIKPGSKSKLQHAARQNMKKRLRRERRRSKLLSILPLWLRKRWIKQSAR